MTTTIIAGQPATLVVTVKQDGAAVAIDPSSVVKVRLYAMDGVTALSAEKTLTSASPANWQAGLVAAAFTNVETGALALGECMLVVTSTLPTLVKRFRVLVESSSLSAPVKSALFVKDLIVDEMRGDRLLLAAQNALPSTTVSDDYLWGKIQAAESEIAHTLRVPLVPTQFFANQPSQAEIDALAGKPYAIDPAYDYGPEFFQGERWGFIVTRQKPINSVSRVRFVYPAPTQGVFDVPADWIRMDRKYGHIRFVPASSAFLAPMGAFLMQALGGGRTIPFAIEVTYVAGLENAARDWPELLDAIKKMAALKIVEDSLLPQSGSISADGLSQSMSVDMEKYRDTVDHIINGPKGSNGGLMAAIHGIRLSILGS